MATYKIKLQTDKLWIVDTETRELWMEDEPDTKTELIDSLDPTHPTFAAEVVEGPDDKN